MSPESVEAAFEDRYTHLIRELSDLVEQIPQLQGEPHGPQGLRIHAPQTNREVRITPLSDQSLVHFVFGHTTLGTLHRAEHHASRPFGDKPPDPVRLVRQLVAFLVDGVEPRWLVRRPPRPDAQPEREPEESDAALELPLE